MTGNIAVASALLASHSEAVLSASCPLTQVHRVRLGADAGAFSR